MNELQEYAKPLDDFIGELAERQQEIAALTGDTNYTIDKQRLGLPIDFPNHQKVPCCIYFYYVRVNTDGRLFVTHHFYPGGEPSDDANPEDTASWPPIPRDKNILIPLLQELAEDARKLATEQTYKKTGENFLKIEWRRKAYIAFFIDEVNWKLHYKAGEPSIVFITDKKGGWSGTPNHTFFDALNLPITMPIRNPKPGSPTTDERSAVVFINHMKADEEGNDLEKDHYQRFQFKMFFDVAFSDDTKGMTVIFDPDGTNLGPPVPPP